MTTCGLLQTTILYIITAIGTIIYNTSYHTTQRQLGIDRFVVLYYK